MQTNKCSQKSSDSVAMLLSAIASAATYNDRDSLLRLINAGMTWANSDDENTWRLVENAAKWTTALADSLPVD